MSIERRRQLPSGLMLRMPLTTPDDLLLGNVLSSGGSMELVQRRAGGKTKRFILIPEEEDRGSAAGKTAADVSYLAKLDEARTALAEEEKLAKYILFVRDPACWPPPSVLEPAVIQVAGIHSARGNTARANELLEAYLRHKSEVFGTGIFPLEDVADPQVSATVMESTVSEQTGRCTLAPIHSASATFALKHFVELYGMDDILHNRVAKTAEKDFADRIGMTWHELVEAHWATVEAAGRGSGKKNNSPGGGESVMEVLRASASGLIFCPGQFLSAERPGMTPKALMELLAANASRRVKLTRGVYITFIQFRDVYVVASDRSPFHVKREFADQFTTQFARSIDVARRNGSFCTAVITPGGGADGGDGDAANPQPAVLSADPADSSFSFKGQKIIQGTPVAHFTRIAAPKPHASNASTAGVKVRRGEGYFILHGPRVKENFQMNSFLVDEASRRPVLQMLEEELTAACEDEKTRQQILRVMRSARETQVLQLANLNDSDIKERLLEIFSEHGGLLTKKEIMSTELRHVAPDRVGKVLKSIAEWWEGHSKWRKRMM